MAQLCYTISTVKNTNKNITEVNDYEKRKKLF